jgi:caa(3)-type oxidase subunit IV
MTAHDPSPTTDDEAPRGVSSAGQTPPAPAGRRYIYAWAALLVLTAVSFGADQLHLGSISTAIALLVAVLKASIVFVVFMHLDREPFPIRFVAGLNVAWVLLLCLGIAADVGTMTHAN